jgi:Ni/Fe-hydrogenase subunit HybB-like protein
MGQALSTTLTRGRVYWGSLGFSISLMLLLCLTLLLLFWNGVGIWNNNIPVTWALDIVSYDWWIGIACGALLTAAILSLTGNSSTQTLQTLAATLAVLAAAAAAVYPIIHLGRPWFFFWNLPYPNSFGLWPQVRSPLFWDAIDILAFLGIAFPFWYLGLLPTLARLRDRAFARVETFDGPGTLKAQLYGIAALGWRGSAAHWQRWQHAMRVLAIAGIGVVVVLQTGAAIMFSGTLEPGWHDTLMPVEFLTEAALAGIAVLAALAAIIHLIEGSAAITPRHLQTLAWLMLIAGCGAGYCFAVSQLTAYFSGDVADLSALRRRMAGPQAWSFWLLIFGGLLPVHLIWRQAFRRSIRALIAIGLLIAAGIWSGHVMVIVATLQQDFLPISPRPYTIGLWEWTTFAGSIGLFLTLLLIVLRIVPVAAANPAARSAAEPSGRHAETGVDAPIWGVSAEFLSAADADAAWQDLHRRPRAQIDALSPAPIRPPPAFSAVFAAGLAGFILGTMAMFAFCVHADDYAYVLNIGGRPTMSWPEYIVPALSCGLLCCGLAATLTMLIQNRLPRLNHPAFNIPGIDRATSDRFFIVLSHPTATLDVQGAEQAFKTLAIAPIALHRVPR